MAWQQQPLTLHKFVSSLLNWFWRALYLHPTRPLLPAMWKSGPAFSGAQQQLLDTALARPLPWVQREARPLSNGWPSQLRVLGAAAGSAPNLSAGRAHHRHFVAVVARGEWREGHG